ncbi:M23 family metallopeptidase [Edaphobacter albus]|uniref:M23 family metallopeptidase n=1 Tax=Edaphobacter sp. 4G125 TaxID=2763071 RepID=UPI001644776F|nr:M23 family metallopeptidase [Edaphobacter sp. 4G125]QNI35990.1 M23 family metallopeptidase [Edaphobacter sp. 4G125]
MLNSVRCWVTTTSLLLVACTPFLAAQESSQHGWYTPLTNGDGLRYPLEIGPLTSHLVGTGIHPVKGSDGLIHVAYALQLTNSWSLPATIKSVEVVDPAHGNQVSGKNRVLDIKNEDVTGQVKLFSLPGTMNKESYTTQIPSGQSGVMFFDITYDDISQVPKAIAHRITVTTPPTPVGTEHTTTGHSIPIGREAIVISPPLKGSGWVNGNGCCLEVGPHRFVTNPMNGTLDPSETFAIDWVQVDAHGFAYRTDGKKPQDWIGYGAEILAVAPGTVVEVVSGLSDVIPGKNPEGLTIAHIAGNRVIIDMGSGRYAMYAHLAPGSIQVHVGDYVRQGQKLGLLGNTGNSSAPHLHFQIMDRPSSLDDTSLPFVFDQMNLEGRVLLDLTTLDENTDKKIALHIDKNDAKPLTRTMPLSRDVLGFQ